MHGAECNENANNRRCGRSKKAYTDWNPKAHQQQQPGQGNQRMNQQRRCRYQCRKTFGAPEETSERRRNERFGWQTSGQELLSNSKYT